MAGGSGDVTYGVLDAGYHEHMLSGQGEVLPPICWLEALGIEHASARRWAVEHLRGLVEAYHHEEMSDGEMVLVCAVDMFLAGLGLGVSIRG